MRAHLEGEPPASPGEPARDVMRQRPALVGRAQHNTNAWPAEVLADEDGGRGRSAMLLAIEAARR